MLHYRFSLRTKYYISLGKKTICQKRLQWQDIFLVDVSWHLKKGGSLITVGRGNALGDPKKNCAKNYTKNAENALKMSKKCALRGK
jgi:hypothetical protein